MQVDHTKTIIVDPEHSIEFGQASWDNSVQSIRRRKNNSNGTYDPYSSSEIPIDSGFVDIARLFSECLKKDLIGKTDMAEVLKEILESAKRKGFVVTLV